MRKLFIALLSALLCLLLSVSALAADGLSTFQETQTYQPGMFSDVKAGSWYEAGVRAVYTRGIMNGTAIFCMWTANAIITWTFPPMMETLGGGITYTIYGVLNLVVAVVLFKIMPETKDKSLEEIEVEMEKLYS